MHRWLLFLLVVACPAFAQGAPPPCPGPIGTQCIDLSWTASTTTGVTYDVYRGIGPGKESTTPYAQGLTTAAYQDTAVTAGNSYCYLVTAHNGGGQSTATNESCALPNPPSPPSQAQAVVP